MEPVNPRLPTRPVGSSARSSNLDADLDAGDHRSPDAAPADDDPPRPGSLLVGLVRTARPRQWLKNSLVLAAPAAAGVLDQAESARLTAVAFVAFCLAASGTYFLNDAIDVEADRRHPHKRARPVAAGSVPVRTAKTVSALLLAAGIGVSFLADWQLAVVVGSYAALTAAYSVWLKHEPVVDLAAVAAGFVLRTIAGGVAVGVPISNWFLIVAGAGSLFMVAGKRHAEHLELGTDAVDHRRSLAGYSHAFLTYVRSTSSSVAILAYCLWAFEKAGLTDSPVWFQLSIVPFVLGVLRYALLLEQGRGGAPEELVLSDRTLQIIGALWAVLFGIAIYAS